MKAFETSVNGRCLVTAGIDHNVSIVHSILEIHGGILNHIIRGVDSEEGEMIDWSGHQPKMGDEITIKIIETDRVSSGERRPLPADRPMLPRTRPD